MALSLSSLISAAPGVPQLQEQLAELPDLGKEATRVLLSGLPRRWAAHEANASLHRERRAARAASLENATQQRSPPARTPLTGSGKTSMLFHLSCQAAQQAQRVVWLCSQARLEQGPPLLPPALHRSNPLLANIAFK